MQLVHQLRTSSSNCREDALLGASSSIQQLWTATLKSFPWKLRNTAIVQLQPCMQRAIPNLERGSEKVVLYRGRRSGSPQRNYMPFGNEESCDRKWRRGNGSRFAKDEQASFCGRSSSEIEVIKRKKKRQWRQKSQRNTGVAGASQEPQWPMLQKVFHLPQAVVCRRVRSGETVSTKPPSALPVILSLKGTAWYKRQRGQSHFFWFSFLVHLFSFVFLGPP